MKKSLSLIVAIFLLLCLAGMVMPSMADTVCVSTWDELKNAAEIPSGDRTVVVMQNVVSTTAYSRGIDIWGNITVLPASAYSNNEIKIDANQMGRIFTIHTGGNLTLCRNGSVILNVTGGVGAHEYVPSAVGYYDGNDYFGDVVVGGAIFTDSSGKFVLNDGLISYNIVKSIHYQGSTHASNGGGIYVNKSGTILMYGGQISNNHADGVGGGVDVAYGGNFDMYGGVISNNSINSVPGWGGGIYCHNFTMYGGTISNNSGAHRGGGISTENFTMYDGLISGNKAYSTGGGVAALNITMYGGEILGNRAVADGGSTSFGEHGGGVSAGFMIMNGGKIEGNSAKHGGGLLFTGSGNSLILSGSAIIDENNDIELYSNEYYPTEFPTIIVDDGYCGTGNPISISVNRPSAWLGQTIISNYQAYPGNFILSTSMDSGYGLIKKSGNITLGTMSIQGPTNVVTGTTEQLSISVNPQDASYRWVSWESADPAIATIDSNGVVTGVSPGYVKINATAYDKTGFAERWISVSAPADLQLYRGWNVVSVPKKLSASNETAAKFFAGVNTSNNPILTYNAEKKQWEQVSATTVISPLNAYWIYSNSSKVLGYEFSSTPTTPAVKNVYAGWNAVGLSATAPQSAAQTFGNTDWYTYLEWNATTQSFKDPMTKGFTDTNLVSLWTGGWLFLNEDGTYMGFTA